MSIAFDTSINPVEVTASSSTYSYTTTGLNRILFVTVRNSGGVATSTVTYAGTSMTKVGSEISVSGGGGPYMVSLWVLINPASGANNVVVNAASSTTLRSGAMSYTGALQSGQPDSTNSNSGTVSPITVSTTVIASGCWLVMVARDGGVTETGSGGAIVRNSTGDAGGLVYGDSNSTVSTGSQSISFTQGSNTTWGAIAASFAPVASASILPTKLLLGVGI